jgi:hypothetical protein
MQTLWDDPNLFSNTMEEERTEMTNIQSFAGTIDSEMSTDDLSYQ